MSTLSIDVFERLRARLEKLEKFYELASIPSSIDSEDEDLFRLPSNDVDFRKMRERCLEVRATMNANLLPFPTDGLYWEDQLEPQPSCIPSSGFGLFCKCDIPTHTTICYLH